MQDRNKQNGAALVVTIIILMLMMMLGLTVMRSSQQDLQMADVAAEKKQIKNLLEGAIDEALQESNLRQIITNMDEKQEITIESKLFNPLQGTLNDRGEYPCRRSHIASSTNVASSCRYVSINFSKSYAKGGIAQANINAGIEQLIIDGNK